MQKYDQNEYNEALSLHRVCERLIAARPVDGDEADTQLRAMVPPGIYEHFKSKPSDRKYYLVEGVSRRVNQAPPDVPIDPFEYEVVYRALYGRHRMSLARRELIGKDGFLMPIDRVKKGFEEDYLGRRFNLIEPCDVPQAFERAQQYLS